MADTLLIHFNTNKPDTATWSLVNTAGELTTMISSGALADAADISAKHKTVVLIDNTPVHIDTVRLPVKNRNKLLRAIPFALEEKIADDVDELHFIAGKSLANGNTPVAAIKKKTLNGIIDKLKEAGIDPIAIIPDTLCLTAEEKQWAILLHGDQANLQFNTYSGSEFDRDMLPLVISSIIQKEKTVTPEKVILFIKDGEQEDKSIKAIEDSLPDNTELIQVSYNQHPLVIYCGQYQNAMPLNLLQDAYKPKQKSSGEWQRWRLAAALAIIWIGLSMGSAATEFYKLQDKNRQLGTHIDTIYKKAFPKSKKIIDARKQMEDKLKELRGSGSTGDNASILTLLSESVNALTSEKGITLQSINYRNSKMDLELTSINLQALESLNKKINRQPIKSEIVSSSAEKNQVKGNIRIERIGS